MKRRRLQKIPWSPDLEIAKKFRPHIPWKELVGDYDIGERGLIRYNYRGEPESGVSSIGALAVIGAIVVAVGAYAYLTNKSQE